MKATKLCVCIVAAFSALSGTVGGYLSMLVIDGDTISAEGPDVVETASSGNVFVVIYELDGRSTPVELRIDGEDVLRCDFDSFVRPVFTDICE